MKVALPITIMRADCLWHGSGSKPTCASTGSASRAPWGRRPCIEPTCLVRQTSPRTPDVGRIRCTLNLILNPGKIRRKKSCQIQSVLD